MITQDGKVIRKDKRLVNRLQSLADERNLSLSQIAREIDVVPSALSMIASGERHASPAILVSLSDYFDCQVEDILEIIPPQK